MPANDRCPNCGAQRPSTAPAGLCPRCLLRLGLGADLSNGRGDSRTSSRTAGGPTASVLDVLTATTGPLPRVELHDTDAADLPEPMERPQSSEMPDPADRPARLQLFGEIARGGMGAVLRGATPTSAARSPSRFSWTGIAANPTWSAGSSRRRRSAASSSIPASCRSTSWAPSATRALTSP